jgi:tetratricopeptide (TPR) repeat protein
LSWVYLYKQQNELAITEAKLAIDFDPNNAEGYVALAEIFTYEGRSEEAIELLEKAMRLNPRYPSYYVFWVGVAYRGAGRYEEAIVMQKRVLARVDFIFAHLQLAANYQELGQEAEARTEVAEVLRINPIFSLEGWRRTMPFKDQVGAERYLVALRQAGLQ